MKNDRALSLILALAALLPAGAGAATIGGDYLEVRTADVWTGPCFANSEVNLAGKQAILAWRVREGGWQGVPLAGLSVVAVVEASATLGDPFAQPLPARAVLIADARADAAQRRALVDFAHAMGGDLLADVAAEESAPIRFEIEAGHGAASLQAGDVASVRTRGLEEGDRHCGNEEVYYPPLTAVAHAHPAFTEVARFSGGGLGGTWSSPDKRSAFVGTFSR